MKIYMYNDWFGDCFRIEEGDKNLFVDFGIHAQCLNPPVFIKGGRYSTAYVDRDVLHKDIADEIVNYKVLPNLLLTHYHVDHYSGLLYMKDNGLKSPAFDTVYLPDIWGLADSRSIIALLFIENLLDNAKLSKRGCTLLEFIKFLCGHVNKIVLLRRGKDFENKKYKALWPDVNKVGAAAKDLISQIDINQMNEIFKITERIILIMEQMIEADNIHTLPKNLFEELQGLTTDFNELSINDYIIGRLDEIPLNSFRNSISVVFQNAKSNNSNILFTGDLEKTHMKLIAKNYDGIVNTHNRYKLIKIPHHGTAKHYYDFSIYNPEILLFPNGKCCNNSYKISDKYDADIKKLTDVKIYCSNSNWCEMNKIGTFGYCNCSPNREIIFPEVCKVVLP